MNDKALANSAVAIIVLNMSIGFANAIQLVGVAVMMRTVLLANQYNCDIGPSFSEKPWKSQEFDLFDRCRRTYSSSNSSTDRYSDEIVIESRNKFNSLSAASPSNIINNESFGICGVASKNHRERMSGRKINHN
jgi:hypothetical protein